ncbi:MAG: hypothetical protein HYX78_03440 [Armatimonadetes bacterium]|nr:hypothetical protein [Armatimonadota bacterium]
MTKYLLSWMTLAVLLMSPSAEASAVSVVSSAVDSDAKKALDADMYTRWIADGTAGWYELRYDNPQELRALSFWPGENLDNVNIEYWDGGKYVSARNQRVTPKDNVVSSWCRAFPKAVEFEPVKTTRLRLSMEGREGVSLIEVWPGVVRTWVTHPPEFYAQTRQEIRDRISRRRQELDISKYPEYLTKVRESPDEIVLERQMWSLVFLKNTCGMSRATIRNIAFDKGFALSSLEVVGTNGKRYYQRLARDGSLTVRDEKFHTYLEGSFTPTSSNGEKFAASFRVVYDLYKTASFITVRYSVEKDGAAAREVRIVNTLGHSKRKLKYLQTPYWFAPQKLEQRVELTGVVAPDRPTGEVVNKTHFHVKRTFDSDKTQVLFEGKIYSALWSDGSLGFQIMPIEETWDEAVIEEEAPGSKYTTIGIDDGKRYADLTLVRSQEGVPLKKGQRFSQSVSLLPYRKYKPSVRLVSWGTVGLNRQLWAKYDSMTPAQREEQIRQQASKGISYVGSTVPLKSNLDWWVPEGFKSNDQVKDLVRTYGRYGVDVEAYICLPGAGPIYDMEFYKREGILQPEEVERLKELAGPPAQPTSTLYSASMNSPEFRDALLTNAYLMFKEGTTSAVYFDCAWYYALTPGYPSQVEGNIQFFEDLILLLETMTDKNCILVHQGFNVTPVEGMVGIMPGEDLCGGNAQVLPAAISNISMNGLLVGNDVFTCDQFSFDWTSSELYKQLLANCVSWVNARTRSETLGVFEVYPGGSSLQDDATYARSETEIATAARFFNPLRTFDIDSSTLHSRWDTDLQQYVRSMNESAIVNLYSRPGETLVVVTSEPGGKVVTTLDMTLTALDIPQKWVLLYDVLNDRTSVLEAKNGRVRIEDVDLTKEPRMFLLKGLDDPGKPLIYWHDPDVRITKFVYPEPGTQAAYLDMSALAVGVSIRAVPSTGKWYRAKLYCGRLGRPAAEGARRGPVLRWDEKEGVADIGLFAYPPPSGAEVETTYNDIMYCWPEKFWDNSGSASSPPR